MVSTFKKIDNLFILILCGGTGPRLWPLSTTGNPKQFLSLITKNSLLKDTVLRSLKIVPQNHLYLVSNIKHENKIKKELKNLINPKNIISEPQKKNTTTAIIYGSSIVYQKNPNATVCIFPSDHYIKNVKNLKNDILKAHNLAQKTGSIITLGIKPNTPDPSFGYLLTNHEKVIKFVEKPEKNEAKKLISLNALWNSGMYIFTINSLAKELALHQKDFLKYFQKLKETPKNQKIVNKIYELCPNIAFDKAVSELSKTLLNIKASFDWSDVGEWESVYHHLAKDDHGIAILNKDTNYNVLNSKNCLVHGSNKKLIGLVGVSNLAIIDTKNALLVCDLNSSLDVRALISQIVKNPHQKPFFVTKNDK